MIHRLYKYIDKLISEGFYGELIIKFQKGKITYFVEKQVKTLTELD